MKLAGPVPDVRLRVMPGSPTGVVATIRGIFPPEKAAAARAYVDELLLREKDAIHAALRQAQRRLMSELLG